MYIIGEQQFKTKSDAKNYTRDLLIKNVNKNIKKDDTIWDYLLSMVYLHSDDKIGDGIESFDIKYNKYNNISLFVNQHTIKNIDFSWCYICSFNKTTHEQLLIRALRHSIDYQIKEYRNSIQKLECELCKSTERINIDHILHFEKIRTDFINNTTLNIPLLFDDCLITYQPKFKLQDIEFKTEWDNYHKKHATLRPLCRKCNLKRPNYKFT
jgi:hypothetical protein